MELGDQKPDAHDARGPVGLALDILDNALTDLITTVETGALEQLDAAEKVAVWQRFETFRNRLPLIDHGPTRKPAICPAVFALQHEQVLGANVPTLAR